MTSTVATLFRLVASSLTYIKIMFTFRISELRFQSPGTNCIHDQSFGTIDFYHYSSNNNDINGNTISSIETFYGSNEIEFCTYCCCICINYMYLLIRMTFIKVNGLLIPNIYQFVMSYKLNLSYYKIVSLVAFNVVVLSVMVAWISVLTMVTCQMINQLVRYLDNTHECDYNFIHSVTFTLLFKLLYSCNVEFLLLAVIMI